VPGKPVFLGEGSHFAAWRLPPARGRAAAGGVDLVIKRAGPRFEVSGAGAQRWRNALAAVREVELVPPLELLWVGDVLGLVMPYGEQTITNAQPHWQPVADRIVELRVQLRSLGLALGDVPQGRCWRGVPFLVDWSDLVAAG
jgi:hypothetical protein